ncbi:hypothetical protein Cgig2_025692 [Carnegiea gigantea]|uniref:Uncharacterized protein n=1 Tax=Carnegiea gigantea TaxID=171969 RepID=A0A9Q1JM35_9CARY|nr:hypothetical protein Cgig2_025692 [Carnegiea gigantea]
MFLSTCSQIPSQVEEAIRAQTRDTGPSPAQGIRSGSMAKSKAYLHHKTFPIRDQQCLRSNPDSTPQKSGWLLNLFRLPTEQAVASPIHDILSWSLRLRKATEMFQSSHAFYRRCMKGFTTTSKGKWPPKFIMPDIKFYRIENPNHYVRNFVSDMKLKGIDKDIFNLIFSWTFDKDVMRWYNALGSRKKSVAYGKVMRKMGMGHKKDSGLMKGATKTSGEKMKKRIL